jgi:hypothetical protein
MKTREDLLQFGWVFIYRRNNNLKELWLNPNNIPMRVSFECNNVINIQLNTYQEV